jgi:hypothetical protein
MSGPNGAERAVEVTARSLYEAVGRGLHLLRQNDWVEAIHQNSTMTIAVKEPGVEHTVRIKDFENWLASNANLLPSKRSRANCARS